MKIRDFVETINEEVSSANVYAELFKDYFKKNDAWATMFTEMADMAIMTAEYLQLMCQEYIDENEISDDEMEMWERSKRKASEGILGANLMMQKF